MDDSLDCALMSPNSQDGSFLSDEEVLRSSAREELGFSLASQPRSRMAARLSLVRFPPVSITPLRPLSTRPFRSDDASHQLQVQEATIESLRRTLQSQKSEFQLENELLRQQLDRLRAETTSESRLINIDEIKKLRQALDEKTKKLASVQRLVPMDAVKPTSLFAFLSSEQAQVWTSVCSTIAQMNEATEARNSAVIAQHLDSMVELLESKTLATSTATESLAEIALTVSKALNQPRVPWERVSDLIRKAQTICQEEAQRLGRPEAPAPKTEAAEEYLSDFSDEDFSIEVEEEESACAVVPKLQSALPKYQFSHSGPVSPQVLFELLSLRVLEASEAGLEAFVRRLPFPGGTLMFENFVKDVRTRSPQWWMKTLSAASFDLQHQVREGTFVHSPAWTLWVQGRLTAKLNRYLAQEKTTPQEMLARVFEQGHLSKRELRRVLRDLNFPLNREDCHALFRLLDAGDGFVTSEGFSDFLTTASAPAPVAPTEELAVLSERDARFRLLQAEQRIAELERHQVGFSPNLTKEHTLTLQLATLRKDYDLLTAQTEDEHRQMQSLRLENEQLRIRTSVPREQESDFRRTAAMLEDADKEYRCKLQTLSSERESAVAELKRRHEEEKAGLMRLIKSKNRELESLNSEVDRLLREFAEIRQSAEATG